MSNSSTATSEDTTEEVPRRLSDRQLDEIYLKDVQPGLARHARQDAPRMVIFGGPQASRKTTLRPLVADQLALTDVVFFDGDDHCTFHPHFDALAREHGALEAARLCGPDVQYLRAKILNEIRERRLNVMFVGPYTHQEYTLGRVASFKADGYETELVYTGLHQALSEVGVMDRHRRALSDGPGYSYLVSTELQQSVFDGVPEIMTMMEMSGFADALHVADAGGIAFSKHRRTDGSWNPPRPSREAVQEIRNLPWPQATKEDYRRRRQAVSTPAGESAEDWDKRLTRVDALAAPMLNPPVTTQRSSAKAAGKGPSPTPRPRKAKKSAPPPLGQRPTPPRAPGRSSSSGRSR